ncbi:hypothetical protein C1I98_12600 [Spongiactinospora gelatinilytica]|uniref:Uncharacterized protein n=1 Tax=Spongiactinospora gelatinilytica TaxID=2666298 RepID=A0A2W2GFA1_9ACTN|nr:hypothetical protein [Spongiactinospora gelatinilytica]PZG48256.1 hypothetical protein C1I98_12600 [Spongiactinospora gelatinilytica]
MLVDERAAVREPSAAAPGRPRWWTPRTRKFVLLLHVVSAVGRLDLNLAMPTLGITGMTTTDPRTQHAVYLVRRNPSG